MANRVLALTLIAAPVTDLCEDSTLQGDHRQKLRLVNANVQRLSRLVNSLLDVSKIDASKMKPEWQRVQIVKLTGDLCALFKSAFEKAKLQLHIACDHDRDIYAIVDMSTSASLRPPDVDQTMRRHVGKNRGQPSLKWSAYCTELLEN